MRSRNYHPFRVVAMLIAVAGLLSLAALLRPGAGVSRASAGAVASSSGDPLTFTVASSKPVYAAGEPVSLALTLSLAAGAAGPASVTTFGSGTVHVDRVLRDGHKIAGTTTSVRFEEDPYLLQVEALATLAPGESTGIPFTVQTSATGSVVHDVTLRSNHHHTSTAFALDGPGVYTVRLSYRYWGGDGGKPGVVRTLVVSNDVTFEVLS